MVGQGYCGSCVSLKWSKLDFPTPYKAFPGNSGRGEVGRAMQDILTGCDGWTAAGALRCGKKSQLSGAFGLWCFLGYY